MTKNESNIFLLSSNKKSGKYQEKKILDACTKFPRTAAFAVIA